MDKKPVPSGLKFASVILILLYWWTLIGIIAGIWLWKGKNWARIIGIILSLAGAILEIYALAAGIVLLFGPKFYEIAFLIINILMLIYLLADEKLLEYYRKK